MIELAEIYIKQGVLTEQSVNDARHIAIATISGASAIISWDFKHMANFFKNLHYNAINLLGGHRLISIHTPMAIIEY